MADIKVKKIDRRIYEFDFSKCEVLDKREFFAENGVSEFVTTFKKQDLDNGIVVTPSGYHMGLFYSVTNDGEIYSSPRYNPDIVTFNFNFYGLKKGKYYRLTIPARSTGSISTITTDRTLRVTTDAQDILINENLTDVLENKEYYGLFKAESNEINLFFTIGKIYISDIIVDEIELLEEEEENDEEVDEQIESGKLKLAAYGVYNLKANYSDLFNGRYLETTKYTGKGINVYYDRVGNTYVIERDNVNDILGTSFTSANYFVEININKTENLDKFNTYRICTVSAEPSPNTIKQGYIRFDFVDYGGNRVDISNYDSRVTILVYKLM